MNIMQFAPQIESLLINPNINKVFFEIGAIIIIATIFAFIADRLKQPLIPAYIITGLILGPIYGLITNKDLISTLSEIGIAFLLFIVGLEMDLKKLKDVSLVSCLGGTIRSISMFTLGFIIALVIGFVTKEAIYIGIIIAFSSTMIVVKLLSDKREVDTLHGRIVIGILLMQDIIAIVVLLILNNLDNFSSLILLFSLLKGILLFATAYLCGKFVFPHMLKFAAKSQELLFLIALTICFLFAFIFGNIGSIIIALLKLLPQTIASSMYSMLAPGF